MERPLLGWGGEAQRSDGGSVPATVHILVHLLGNLLSVTKVCCGDGNSVEEESADVTHGPTLQLKQTESPLTAS